MTKKIINTETLLQYSAALVPLTPCDIVEVYVFAFFDIDGSNYTASASVTVKLSSKGRLINLFRTPMLVLKKIP